MAIKFPTVTLRDTPGLKAVVNWKPMTPKHPSLETSGTFTRDTLPRLLAQISEEQRSGKLHLRSGAFRAFVAFNDGQPVLARFGTQVDAMALERIVALEAGVYEFEPGQPKSSAMIASDSEALSHVLHMQKHSPELGPISGSSVPVKLDVETVGSGTINLMRIHWQLMTHIDGHRSFDAIAGLVGLNRGALERPLRDLVHAGLIALRSNPPTLHPVSQPTPTQPEVRVTPTEAPVMDQIAAIKKTGETGTGQANPHDTRSGKTTTSRSIALERLSAIRDTVAGRNTPTEASPSSVPAPAPLQAMQVSGPINPGFFSDLQPRLASLIGPMATLVLEDAAELAGGTLSTLHAEQLDAFLRAVVAEVPTAKHAQLRELVRPLLKRYGLRPTKENG